MTYNAYITKITNIHKHPNADRLALGSCFGNQVVIGLDIKENDIGIYFPTDGQLSMEFMSNNNLVGKVDETTGERTGGFFDEKGRVRTQKFRKEKSDGFWIPIKAIEYTGYELGANDIGKPFTELNHHHICNKYVTEKTRNSNAFRDKKERIKSAYPNFHKHIDTEQLMYNLDRINEGDYIVITEKLHGTSGRSAHTDKVTKVSGIKAFINRILKRAYYKPESSYDYVCGSRNVTLTEISIDYAGDEGRAYRQSIHRKFLDKLHKGETIYYEIVGWTNQTSPIMNECSNKKLNDKEFVKQYGDTTIFHYGCAPGEQCVYVYRITLTNPDGIEIDYSWEHVKRRCQQLDVNHVPELSCGIIDNKQSFVDSLDAAVDRCSSLSPAHIMEGIVVRVDGSQWLALKYKSTNFKILEGIIKSEDVIDIEESS
jgi:hypothetical protein